MPQVISYGRDLRFVSKFWDELFSLLGMDLRFSTAFHPQTDGQSEVTIRVLENVLRPYIEHRPSTWVYQLPLAKFTVNNAITVSTGYSPFYLNQGSHPLAPNTLLAKGKPKVSIEAIKEALEWMKTALVDAKSNLTVAQQWMKRAVDKKRGIEEYKIGNKVVVSITNLWTYCPSLPPKIKARWVGPFHIQKIVSPVAFGLTWPWDGGSIPSSIPGSLNAISEGGRAAASCIGGGYSGV